MTIYTSYFYQIRFFPTNLVPLSTAVWDPKWFYDNKKQGYVWKDKRGVLNGIRATPFVPNDSCNGLCRGKETCETNDPEKCLFLKVYLAQLRQLDFSNIIQRFHDLGNRIGGSPDFALIFHEAPNNPCSERWMVQKWFKENNFSIKEWQVENFKNI